LFNRQYHNCRQEELVRVQVECLTKKNIMKIILVLVSSLDGKVTLWNDPFVRKWSSKADQEYFNKIWNDSPLIVMGSNTYNADPPKSLKNNLLIIMTSAPEDYKKHEVPGRIEFTDMQPSLLAGTFGDKGYEQMVVVGGPHIATSFLKAHLINELWLTFEPRIFGSGESFVINENLDIFLQLISYEKVNEQGTMIMKYRVVNNQD
jgi:dihydrofolate reductase